MAILPENEYTEFEDRQYINPQLPVDETESFIKNLRGTQQANNQQVTQQTQQLGADVPSNLGGLAGGTGYWTSRYQTPQTNSAVADLRATAQAAALNDALANEKAKWQKRYNDAYRAYQQRQNAKTNTTEKKDEDDPEKESTTPSGTAETSVSGYEGTYTTVDPSGNLHVIDMYTGDEEVIAPGETSKTRRPASDAVGGGTLRTLPNGNAVLVKPGYVLIKEDGKYYLVNQSSGARTEVGGY